jgi:hypothetical protein
VINDVVLGATIEKFLMGFVATANTYISRVGIETITANTLSSVPVTAGNVNTVLASTNTVIDGGRITTGYISANRIDAGTITSSKLSTNIALIGGSAYSAGFPYPSGTITGTPSGFRLSSAAAGTSADPTIYGAYIKGGVLDGATITGQLLDISNMKVANGGATTGAFSIAMSVANGNILLHGKNFGTGYLYTRCLLASQRIMITSHADYTLYDESNSMISKLQISINGGAWSTLVEKTQVIYGAFSTTSSSGTLPISYLYTTDAASFNTIEFRSVSTPAGNYILTVQTTNI